MTLDEFVARLVDREPPASPGDVEALESEIGSRLPDDFRRFLMRCDGGYAAGTCFVGPKPDGEDTYVTIADVFGLRYGDDRSLRHLIRSSSAGPSSRPPALLPIMGDLGGNLICLALTGEDRGRVYFFDHERSPDPSDWEDGVGPESHLERLADSFADFVDGLQPADEPDA
jgi:cell wall assembly regulator SMI1